MPEDNIASKMLAVLDYSSSCEEYAALYSLLVGSAAALIQCRKLIEETSFSQNTWGTFGLHLSFIGALDACAHTDDSKGSFFNWQMDEDMSLWSIGFFLDKAQNNIAAAVDGCVNAWLLSKPLLDIKEKPQIERELLGLWVGIRLRLLNLLVEVKEHNAKISGLWNGFEKYADTDVAKDYIHRLAGQFANQLEGQVRENFIEFLFDEIPTTEEECVSIVFSRVNAFKHQTTGVIDRYGYIYYIEWVITTKAFLWLGEFWQSMSDDTTFDPLSAL